jgi:flavin-dependent dehydrogenase
MHHSDYSVVIVGGGPAGSATAIKCAEKGLKTAILESEPHPFIQIRPGESLHPGLEPVLKELGLKEATKAMGFLRHNGIWIKWDQGLRLSQFGRDESGPWMGFQLWRKGFDEMLLGKARSVGAEVFRPCRAIRPMVEKGKVVGVMTTMGVFQSKHLVDASGANHWLARNLDLEIKRSSPTLIAWYGYVEGSCPIRDVAPAIVADNDGWTWTARVHNQIYQWTKLCFEKKHVDPDYLPPEFRGRDMEPISEIRGADVTWRIVRESANEGYFITGDAAFVLDPLSSHGVLKALMSGMMAAHLLDKLLIEGENVDHVSQVYRRWVSNWYEHDISHLIDLYKRHPWSPSWVNTLMERRVNYMH